MGSIWVYHVPMPRQYAKRDTAEMKIRVSPDIHEAFLARSAYENRSLNSIAERILGQAAKRWNGKANGPAGAQADEATPARRNHADDHDSSTRVNGRAD